MIETKEANQHERTHVTSMTTELVEEALEEYLERRGGGAG